MNETFSVEQDENSSIVVLGVTPVGIAKEHVSEANQLTFTSNPPATIVSNNIELAAVRCGSIIEITESICDQDPILKNPFSKNQFRNRPPSYLKRPTQDWLHHSELVHQVMKPMKHSRDAYGQFLFDLQPDLSKNIAFLLLIVQRWF
ncbi:Hypothetical predicted protein [Paramuricea clavata]|uniref:Uncharacterized protein n=1 Tax=Paramuricea clavata TaxID=317549 RepID=A0A6S7G7C3_PARCT|nr:Hypothetical predicted protein [Paramuricea clavata]